MMKDEIKEILDRLKNSSWEKDEEGIAYKILFSNEVYKLLDYITNLQEESERLKNKPIIYEDKIKNRDNDFLYNKCVNQYHQLMNSQYKNKEYKEKIDKAVKLIQYIIDYGFDYDGFNTVENLKGLIDMLVDYARQSKDILNRNN